MTRRRRASAAKSDGGNSPTHYLKMKTTARNGGGWSRVGSAWQKPGGETISVKLSRGVVLDWRDFESGEDGAEFVMILVPAD